MYIYRCMYMYIYRRANGIYNIYVYCIYPKKLQFTAYGHFVLVITLSLMPTPSQFVCVFTVQPKIQPKLPILENLISFNIHLFKYYLFRYFLFIFPCFLLLFLQIVPRPSVCPRCNYPFYLFTI